MMKHLPLERLYRDSRCGALMLPWTAELILDRMGRETLYEAGRKGRVNRANNAGVMQRHRRRHLRRFTRLTASAGRLCCGCVCQSRFDSAAVAFRRWDGPRKARNRAPNGALRRSVRRAGARSLPNVSAPPCAATPSWCPARRARCRGAPSCCATCPRPTRSCACWCSAASMATSCRRPRWRCTGSAWRRTSRCSCRNRCTGASSRRSTRTA